MSRRDLAEFLLLAAIWGGSFLFMRVAAPALGPVTLMLLRCSIAAAFLLLVLGLRGGLSGLGGLARNAGNLAIVGVVNSAIPFVLLGYATLTLSAGITSILNSLAPLWSALIAFAWFGDRLTRSQLCGLGLGVFGVSTLVAGAGKSGDTTTFMAGLSSLALPFTAAVAATAAYGLAANFSRRRLQGVDPLVIATGSQLSASMALLLPGLWLWPETHLMNGSLWLAVVTLGIVCTGVAYLLFFRLIRSVGPTRTVSVTFVIPVFGVALGWWFLDERITLLSLSGALVIVLGTALATGVLRVPPCRV